MRRMITTLLMMTACGAEPRPPTVVQGRAPGSANELTARDFITTPEHGSITTTVWIEPSRVAGIAVDDPCCGLWYDGAQYADANATCAPAGNDECDDALWTVRPGLADDPVCGERRRCMPLPQARIVVLDGSAVTAEDLTGELLPSGRDAAQLKHGRVGVTREGAFVMVAIGTRRQMVAVDLGARYTIYVQGGAIQRVTRDDA
ncbi:MAG: hypothetical protein JWP01_2594 [Myxococcales bacterium]|nr:hypothetical protein [Myxococcales bacterium]